MFHSPLHIAVVGAGLGGLMCARVLHDQGLRVTLFDKSPRPGGRCATRSSHSESGPVVEFDHGAQYFTLRSPQLESYLESWQSSGVVARWNGRIVELAKGKIIAEKSNEARYVGTPKMRSLAEHLSQGLSIHFDTTIDRCETTDDKPTASTASRAWRVYSGEQEFGPFDVLLLNMPPEQVQQLLPQSASALSANVIGKAHMTPSWAVMLRFDRRINAPFDGAFLNDAPLSWIARNSSKPGRNANEETWVLHSSAAWAADNLHRENNEVANDLLNVFRDQLREFDDVPEPALIQAHRWRYAAPNPSLDSECVWNESLKWGACGDWCKGPRLENALLSGMALAGRVMAWQNMSLLRST